MACAVPKLASAELLEKVVHSRIAFQVIQFARLPQQPLQKIWGEMGSGQHLAVQQS